MRGARLLRPRRAALRHSSARIRAAGAAARRAADKRCAFRAAGDDSDDDSDGDDAPAALEADGDDESDEEIVIDQGHAENARPKREKPPLTRRPALSWTPS